MSLHKNKSVQGIDNESDAAMAMVSDNTAKLTSAVNSLPQLLEKKRLIDMHTTIATGMPLVHGIFRHSISIFTVNSFLVSSTVGILNAIKTRRLDTLFELEEKIMSKAALDRNLLELISDSDAGITPDDKMRLFIIYYICYSSMSEVCLLLQWC